MSLPGRLGPKPTGNLERRLDFERRLTTMSAALMRSEPDDLDDVVVQALASVGSFFDVDRAYVFEIDEAAGHQSNTHEWVARGISVESHNLQKVPLDTFPWLMAELIADRTVALDDIGELPESAVSEREEFLREGIRSIAIVPVWSGAQLAGFAGFDAVRRAVVWDEDYILGLRLLGQMLGSALRSRTLARRLQEMAFHDALTGLPNRVLLEDRLQAAMGRARRYQRRVVVAMVDLDDFKPVNDKYGHAVGDAVLCQVADRLKSAVRSIDTVARWGGDEFVIVIEDVAEPLVTVAERLLAAFTAPFEVQGEDLQLSPSIGVVEAGTEKSDTGQLIQRADAAMYQAKAAGKHCWFRAPS